MKKEVINYIDNIINGEIARIKSSKDPFLKHGEMGIALSLFGIHDLTGWKKYKSLASYILNNLNKHIPSKPALEIYQGITGIGLAIIFCKNKGYIEDNIDDLLAEIDNYVYKYSVSALQKYSNRYLSTFLDILVYIFYRHKYSDNNELKHIFAKLWLKIYDMISLTISTDNFYEPIPSDLKYNLAEFIYICSLGIQFDNFHKKRIHKVLSDLENFIIANTPILQSNKLILAIAIHNLTTVIGEENKWQEYKESLIKNISIEHIIENELLPNDIHMTHGVPCIYWILYLHKYTFKEKQLQIIIEKIGRASFLNSSYSSILNMGFVGLDGILGTIYTLLHIKKYSNGQA